MKEYYLSTAKERTASVVFTAIIFACFGILLYALRNNMMLLILCGLGSLLLMVLLIISVIGTLKSKCILDAQNKTIEVKGFPSYTIDISQAVLLQTLPRRNSQAVTRVLVFTDAQENIIATVPTLFTHRQGMQAEPMAKEMAQFLGIEFQQNVPAWEYDKEAYKQHLKDEAEAKKAARKERIELRRQKLLRKYGKK
jgi:hypothetical protein